MKPTLGLAMICKDEVEAVSQIVKELDPYIDGVFLTITHKDRLEDFKKAFKDNLKVEITYFEWCKDFSKARNYNLRQVTTDYWMWVDSDDIIQHAENIPKVVAYMKANQLDCVYFPYNYMQDEDGNCVALHDRERILRTDHPFYWKGAIHESPLSRSVPRLAKMDDVVIKHNKSIDEVPESAMRNHEILLEQYDKGTRNKKYYDPRTIHYLGLSYFMQRQYDDAIKMFLEHIKSSGWDEESYRSWLKIAEAHIIIGNYPKANAAASAAIDLLPSYPLAYLVKAQIAYEEQAWEKVIEWNDIAESKPEPDTLSISDPSLKIRVMMCAANAYANLGKPREAFGQVMKAKKLMPNSSQIKNMYPLFEYGYFEDKFFELIKWIAQFYEEHRVGDVKKLIGSLGSGLFSDARLTDLRRKYIPPKKWPKKSVVFYCGSTLEPWGADTLDKGMGGSEEAIVYLSRELSKLGWGVTIYNERDDEYMDGEIEYKPWSEFNPLDEFDVFVSWRAPENCSQITARKKLVDLHDAIDPKRVIAMQEDVDKYMVKSKYHRELFKDVAVSKFAVISNGIKESY